jgi:hypothetical protein
MTNETMAFQALLEKTSDADPLREMLGFVAERFMELDVGSKTAAAWGEKSAERLALCCGYRDRVWETRAGPHRGSSACDQAESLDETLLTT